LADLARPRGAEFASMLPMPEQEATRIVIVAPEPLSSEADDEATALEMERSRSLRIGLLEAGYNIVAVLPVDTFLPERLAQIQPDMIIVDAESQARDTLEHVVMATRDARRPIVMFTEDNDTSHVREAIASGVTAYVVAGLAPERVKPVLEVALARFEHEERLRTELAEVRTQLADRKVVDRAKGLLMQRHQIAEPEAYARIRKAAMDKGLKMADIAQRIVDAADLLM
jgi:two-component system, response regulator / RNA-binding antiterminator